MENSSRMPIQQVKEKEVITIVLEKTFINIRSLSPKRLRFEVEYGLERGTSANSFYIPKGFNTNKEYQPPILIHPPGGNFSEIFIKKFSELLPPTNDEILILMGHINPNRIQLIKDLMSDYPGIKIICSSPGAKLLEQIWNQKKQGNIQQREHNKEKGLSLPEIKIIKDKERISVAHGYVLEGIIAPTARWPGGLLAFEHTQGLLMSDKFFGAHLCTTNWAENNRISTEEDRRHYFDSLMGSMTTQVNTLIEKLNELEIKTIAPGHGPAIESSWRSLLNDYYKWGESQGEDSLKVVLLFASAYGNTASIANALAKGILRTGVRIESLNCEFTSNEQLINSIQSADAYLIGSPTLGGHAPTPIMKALGTLLSEGNPEKPIGIFGSFGWSGEALDLLENKLRNGGFEFGFDPIKIKFTPNTGMIKTLEETGTIFGRKLLKARKRNTQKATGGMITNKNDPAILALGRIVGSLSVLTAVKGEGEAAIKGGMIASWISQASFNPPGISVAVAKDRAVEGLLHCGDHFTVNILAEGKHRDLMKQFLQPFPPGADRFDGLQIKTTTLGQPILSDALAWLEGCVEQRMECGDHWVIYAEIKNGNVLDHNGITAVHHRQTGSNY